MPCVANREPTGGGQVGGDDRRREPLKLCQRTEFAVQGLDQPSLVLGVDVLPQECAEQVREVRAGGPGPRDISHEQTGDDASAADGEIMQVATADRAFEWATVHP